MDLYETQAMPDAEVLKIALQGGMFAVWMIFIYWLLFYGTPMLRDIFNSMSQSIERLAEQHRLAAEKMTEQHRLAAEKIAEQHRIVSEKKDEECREERRELAERYATEREKDRNARHDANNQLQVMIGRMCEIVDRYTDAAARPQDPPKRRTS